MTDPQDAADPSPSDGPAGLWARSTAPQSPYSMRQVAIGVVVLLVGLAVTYGLGILAA